MSPESARCTARVAKVDACQLHFRGSLAPACGAGVAPLLPACWLTGDLHAKHREAVTTCNAVFDTSAPTTAYRVYRFAFPRLRS